jgi:hypothetical protein
MSMDGKSCGLIQGITLAFHGGTEKKKRHEK